MTRARHFLSILRSSVALVAIFEIAIVAVLVRLVASGSSQRFVSVRVAADGTLTLDRRFGQNSNMVVELLITAARLLVLLALLCAASPFGEQVSYVPLPTSAESSERFNLAPTNGAVANYGSDRNA